MKKKFLAVLAVVSMLGIIGCQGEAKEDRADSASVSAENMGTDTSEQMEEDTYSIKNAEIGDIVYLGCYEQDNDFSNGKEKIAWRVLEISPVNSKHQNGKVVNGKTMVLFSESVLDICYTNEVDDWLSETFEPAAFSEQERSQFFSVVDNIGLLRESELANYFTSVDECRGRTTEFAKAKYEKIDAEEGYDGISRSSIGWWLELGYYVSDGYSLNSKFPVKKGYDKSLEGMRPKLIIWVEVDE